MVFRLGIFGVLIAALIAVMVFAYSILNQSNKPAVQANAPPPPTEQILTAAIAMPGGTLLQPSSITGSTVLINAAPAGALLDNAANRNALNGAMIRASLAPGAPLLNNQVIHPGDHGFLAAVLEPGMRAVTVSVDNVTGANGLIWPGDYVDVLLTQTIAGAPDSKSIAAEIVLDNVRVIATGATLVKDASAGAGQPTQTVTLEVTEDQASRCLVASNLGRLALIVHSAQGVQTADVPEKTPEPVWAGDVSPALANVHPQEQQVTTVNVITAGAEGEFKF